MTAVDKQGSSIVAGNRWSQYRYIALFLALWACYGYFVQGLGPNELSRYDFVRALVDDHSLTIDSYHQNTIDKGYYDGHYYSDKAFGLSVLATPVYATVRTIDRLMGQEKRNDHGMVYFLVLMTVALPSAALAVLIGKAGALVVPQGAPLLIAAVYGFGTIAFPFATMFFGHQTASFFAFASAYLLISLRLGAVPPRRALERSLFAGLLAGAAALFEYPAGLVGAVLAGYILLFFPDRRCFIAFLAGVMPAVFVLGIYNYLAFGDPISISYTFTVEQNFPGIRRGLMGVSWPDFTVVLQLLFAGKGLIVNAPVLALVPVGLWNLYRRARSRPEALLCAAVGAVFLMYNSGDFNPFGGWTPGPRYLTPALPFLVIPLALAVGRSLEARAFFGTLAAWSILVMTVATITGPLAPEDEVLPITADWLPKLLRGEFVYNIGNWVFGLRGVFSLAPLAVVVGCALAVMLIPSRSHRNTAGDVGIATEGS